MVEVQYILYYIDINILLEVQYTLYYIDINILIYPSGGTNPLTAFLLSRDACFDFYLFPKITLYRMDCNALLPFN